MKSLAVVAILLLIACSSPSATPPEHAGSHAEQASTKRLFETRIAEAILEEVSRELPTMAAEQKSVYLQQKISQFDQAVDTNLVPGRILMERDLLSFLAEANDTLTHSSDYGARLNALTSLDLDTNELERWTLQELDRLGQTIAVLAAPDQTAPFDLPGWMAGIRSGATYPADSFDGRQAYLDRLSREMVNAQVNWYDLVEVYAPSALSLLGEEGSDRTFDYSSDGLVINLAEVTDLPDFELASVAVFYGFPGLQSFSQKQQSLRSEIELPAYSLGWAGYILEEIATRDVQQTLQHLYFVRLLTALALADVRINMGKWTAAQAVDYLLQQTPYHRHRLELMVNQIQRQPGHYLAATAGKRRFTELQHDCLMRSGECQSVFNQRIIDVGPVPFKLLEQYLAP